MPITRGKQQPFRREAPVFFHLRPVWLAMAWVGLLGESNQHKAHYHVSQLRQFVKEGG